MPYQCNITDNPADADKNELVASSNISIGLKGKRMYPEWNGELFLESMERLSKERPDRLSVAFLNASGDVQVSVTRLQLWKYSETVARRLLHNYNINKGDRCLLVYPPGIDFAIALIACLRLGVIAVSVYPPNPEKIDVDIPKFIYFVNDSGSRIALTTRKYKRFVQMSSAISSKHWPKDLTWIITDECRLNDDDKRDAYIDRCSASVAAKLDCKRSPSDLAFIQYTSGSTGSPKGVMLSHGNVSHQCSSCTIAFDTDLHDVIQTEDYVYVGWVPQYHDLGLFGGLLVPLQFGCTSYIMSPLDFLRNPTIWPKAMSKYKANITCAPNFAYGLACKHTRSEGLVMDLSRMKIFANGGEPAGIDTGALVRETWCTVANVKHSAAENTFINGYGQAETSLMISNMGRNCDGIHVSAGNLHINALTNTDTRIVVQAGSHFVEASEGEEGEIWSHSPSVAKGYWNKPEATLETFYAQIDGIPNKHFLRTGDIGYIKGMDLYVTSRQKDLIIVNGKNFSPTCIERCVENAFPVVRPGSSVAFQPKDETTGTSLPHAIIVCEVRANELYNVILSRLARDIHVCVVADMGVPVGEILLVKARSVPKTTSGKVRRHECARRWAEEELNVLLSTSKTREKFADNKVCEMLAAKNLKQLFVCAGIERYDKTLSENGIDSLTMSTIVNASSKLGINLSYEDAATSTAQELFEKYGSPTDTNLGVQLCLPYYNKDKGVEKKATYGFYKSLLILPRQLFVVVGVFFAIAVSTVPSAVLTNKLWTPNASWMWKIHGRLGPIAVVAIVLWMVTFTVVSIALKWIVLGKQRPGQEHGYALWSNAYMRWMLIQRLFGLWEHVCGRFVLDTPYLNLVYILLGANIHPTVNLLSFVRDWDLVAIGRRSIIKGVVYPHFFTPSGVVFNSVVIGQGCRIGTQSVGQGPFDLLDGCEIQASTYIPPSSRLDRGVWKGNPARRQRSIPNMRASKHQDKQNIQESITGVTESSFPNSSDSFDIDESRPWILTQLLVPYIFFAMSCIAVTGANYMLPSATTTSTWTISSMWFVVSCLLVYKLVGVFFLVVSVVLKWSFLSPYMTDNLAKFAFCGFFLYVRKTFAMCYWHRLFGMRIGSSSVLFMPSVCAPSSAHRVSIGKGCLVVNCQLAPSQGPTVWSWLEGSTGQPWWGEDARHRDIVIGDFVQVLLQARIESGICVPPHAVLGAFSKVCKGEVLKPGGLAVGNPLIHFRLNSDETDANERKNRANDAVDSYTLESVGKIRKEEQSISCNHMTRGGGEKLEMTLVQLIMHMGFCIITLVALGIGAILGLEVLLSLPIYSLHFILRIVIAVLYGILYLVLYLWAMVWLMKWFIVGRTKPVQFRMSSPRAVSMMFLQSLHSIVCDNVMEVLFGGLFILNIHYYTMGVSVSLLHSQIFSQTIIYSDADTLTIHRGAILDRFSYASCHRAVNGYVSVGKMAVMGGAVLHPSAGIILGSVGMNAQLMPLSTPLRETHIGDGEVWVGAPAVQAEASLLT
eukprot:CFRG3368T1